MVNWLSVKKLDMMSDIEKEKYYQDIRNYCRFLQTKNNSKRINKKLIAMIAPCFRNYNLEIYGDENIPGDDSAVFVCNHSNSHDFFTTHEVFGKLKRNVTPFGASDCLSFLCLQLFKAGDVTLIDRNDKKSSLDGLMYFIKKVMQGKDGIIFSEGTWNLHPVKPMQDIKAGGTQAAIIARKVIIPTVIEYVEVPDMVQKESELYLKCIVEFGKPMIVQAKDNILEKTREIQTKLEKMRRNLWEKNGIKRNSLSDVNPYVYRNHTYLKKFKAFGFTFDSAYEYQFLLKDANGTYENEYVINENGKFVPGIIEK